MNPRGVCSGVLKIAMFEGSGFCQGKGLASRMVISTIQYLFDSQVRTIGSPNNTGYALKQPFSKIILLRRCLEV